MIMMQIRLNTERAIRRIAMGEYSLLVQSANDEELQAHQEYLSMLQDKSGSCISWDS